MSSQPFTVEDLKTALRSAAGETDAGALSGDILDVEFEDLGYDSVALLETAGQIERDLGVRLPDSCLVDAHTPRALVDTVNERLSAAAAG
jgi:acyl carrier protein